MSTKRTFPPRPRSSAVGLLGRDDGRLSLELLPFSQGFRYDDWRWHADQRPPHYKVELVDGVLTVSLKTRRAREIIAGLAGVLAEAGGEEGVISTSLEGGGMKTALGESERLRPFSLFHEVVVGEVRHELNESLHRNGRATDLVALIGAGWTPLAGRATYWLDGCVVDRVALSTPEAAPAPLLAVEVSEPETRAFDRTERARAYGSGGCEWLLLIDPVDPERRRTHSDLELWALERRGTAELVAHATDCLRYEEPVPFAIDLSEHCEFARAVVAAADADEL